MGYHEGRGKISFRNPITINLMTGTMTIVCFAAHPDDLEFSCTGTLSILKEQGYRIIYIIVTNGENGFKEDDKLTPEKRAAIRREEQMAVGRKLGIEEIIFLGYRDGFLAYTDELRSQLVALIKKFRPEIVFSFDPANREFDNINLFHRDHRIVSEAVFDACFASKNLLMYPGERHKIDKVYFFGSNRPNHFVDISDRIDLKLELLACHKSQFPDFSKVEALIRNRLSRNADSYEYSEAFRVLEVEQMT
jgi:LmbE family N-acetylglucosaminyl deacetylase